ncbi:MAG TPA: ThuA domain-containing protein [Bryobacteraceae bacterium]|nr:ThuA domain-containing protein [Bryobacteraceae bacterium]
MLNKLISRRTALKGAAAPLMAGPAAASIYGRQQATAFALAGDRYHNIDYIRTALGKIIVRDLGVPVDFTDELSLLDARNLKDYKLLIVFRDGMTWPNGYSDDGPGQAGGGLRGIVSDPPLPHWDANEVYWITTEQGRAVKKFVENGGGALFYHNTPYISPHNQDFRDVLGAVTEEHPPLRPFRVRISNRNHPITAGVNDFVVTDEQHFVKYEKDAKDILMQSVNEDGKTWKNLGTTSAAGWAYNFGKGRVCYLAPGHLISALWNPAYVKVQQNAVKWLLKQL